MSKKTKNIQFVSGPLSSNLIVDLMEAQAKHNETGAYTIFCGQVRADYLEEKKVIGIEYTSYNTMANQILNERLEELLLQFNLQTITVIHSIGFVPIGGISVILFISSSHRKAALEAQEAILPIIKFEVPIWKKEMFDDQSYRWA
jgi:molybdopterin synthase catalytic subunit